MVNDTGNGLIVALAGRRIDAEQETYPRFLLANIAMVEQRIEDFFATHAVAALVCSAACGADLIALEAAQRRGVFCCIVLPFGPSVFKAKSVLDRPGDWGKRFDNVYRHLAEHPTQGKVVCLDCPENDLQAYERVNNEIICNAKALEQKIYLAQGSCSELFVSHLMALVVWDGQIKLYRDATESFAHTARRCRIAVSVISTLAEVVE